MSDNTAKVFMNPSIKRFSYSPLTPVETTNHYLNQPSLLLSAGTKLRTNARSSLLAFAKLLAAVMENRLPVSIRLGACKDIGALARIHLTAFRDDHCIRLLYSYFNHWKAIDTLIEKRYSSNIDGSKLAVAVNEGRFIGWLCCTFVDSGISVQQDANSIDWVTAAASLVNHAEERLTKSSGMPEDMFQRDHRWKISKIISNASTEAMMQSLGHNTRFLIVNTLAVDPAWKSRGVGSELLKWVAEWADRQEITVWAQVSPAAHGIFQLAGFEEVHNLVLDLDKYYHNNDDRSKPHWGFYEYKYMVRKIRDPPKLNPADIE